MGILGTPLLNFEGCIAKLPDCLLFMILIVCGFKPIKATLQGLHNQRLNHLVTTLFCPVFYPVYGFVVSRFNCIIFKWYLILLVFA